jgi:hypothetical protein
MGLFRKKLSSVNQELLLVARLCKENPELKERLEFLLSQPDELRLKYIGQWVSSLPSDNPLRKALNLLSDAEFAAAMLAELREFD